MNDSNLVLYNAAINTATTAQGSAIDLRKGGVARGLDVLIHVPQALGTTPTLDITFEFDDSTTFSAATIKQKHVVRRITAAADRTERLDTRYRYVRVNYTSGGTLPDFGTVVITAASGMTARDFNTANS